jgi:hypothetical protein
MAIILVLHIIVIETWIFRKIHDNSYLEDERYEFLRAPYIYQGGITSKYTFFYHHILQICMIAIAMSDQWFTQWWTLILIALIYIIYVLSYVIQILDPKNKRIVPLLYFYAIIAIKVGELLVVGGFAHFIMYRDSLGTISAASI